MCDAVSIAVTVKHRIGIDRVEGYDFVRDFVGTVTQAGCHVFIVHARNAWLQGLSPKENREVPPLRYELVYRLKRDFPTLTIVLNCGVNTGAQITEHLQHVDGVMVGREAYHRPWWLASWDEHYFGAAPCAQDHDAVEAAMVAYMSTLVAQGDTWMRASRHMLGLRNGMPGARHWRQVWSDHRRKSDPPALVSSAARYQVAATLTDQTPTE